MSRSSTLILLGLLIVVTPFSGLPISLRTFLIVVMGAFVVAIAFLLRTREVQDAQSVAQSTAPESSPASTPPTISAI